MTRADASTSISNDQPADAPETHVLEPRQRIFLPQSFGERAATFWWNILWHLLFRWSPPPCNAWRILLLRLFRARIGRGTYIAPSAYIQYPWNLRVGEGVFIAHQIIINCMGTIQIGDRTHISQYAHLCAGTHEYQRRDMRIHRSPIRIGAEVWIAADAFVGPGVTIGDQCLLAARSSAFHDLPAGMICVGEPAKPVKPRMPGDR